MPNPCELLINDLRIAIVNTDVIKDLCPNILTKNMLPAKIDLALRGLHEQRSYYPLYPPHPDTPVEFEQLSRMLLKHPCDLLVTPSDLMQFVKRVDDGGALCVNPGSVIKGEAPGTYCTINVDPFDVRAYRGNPEAVAAENLQVAERVRVEISNI